MICTHCGSAVVKATTNHVQHFSDSVQDMLIDSLVHEHGSFSCKSTYGLLETFAEVKTDREPIPREGGRNG